jgi:hypothetical protein
MLLGKTSYHSDEYQDLPHTSIWYMLVEDCWLYLEVTRLTSGFVGSSTSRVEGISRREEVHDEPRSLVCYQISHGGLQVT